MSAIYFTSEHNGEARLDGPERYHCGHLATGLALGAAGLHDTNGDHWIWRSVNQPRETLPVSLFWGMLRHRIGARLLMPDGTAHMAKDVLLNTAIVLGNPIVAFAARLDGFCESHAYVDGSDRAWLADLIEEGLSVGVLRTDLRGHPLGWRAVIAMLRASDRGPVVTHYSVSDGFPNGRLLDLELESPIFDAMPKAERWERCMAVLRDRWWLRLSPEDITRPCFSSLATLFDLQTAWESHLADR